MVHPYPRRADICTNPSMWHCVPIQKCDLFLKMETPTLHFSTVGFLLLTFCIVLLSLSFPIMSSECDPRPQFLFSQLCF